MMFKRFLRVGALLLLTVIAPIAARAQAPAPVRTPATIRCTAAQTVTAAAYSAGNVVGSLITCPNAVRAAGLGGLLQSAMVLDKAGQLVSYDLFLFDSAPTSPTDKTTIALSSADLAKIAMPVVPISGGSLGAASTMAVVGGGGLGYAFRLRSGTTLYGILVTRGTPTYASTSDVTVDLTLLPD